MNCRRLFAPAVIAFALLACADDEGTGPDPDTVPASVEISPAADTLPIDGETTLDAVVTDSSGNVIADAAVEWSSLDAGVASVDDDGVVTGVAAGATSIVAASGPAADTSAVAVMNPDATTECDRFGYACSILTVGQGLRERIDSIGDAALDMLEDGGSMADLAAELESLDGIVEVLADDAILFFRLRGAPPVGVFGPEALPTPPDTAPASAVRPAARDRGFSPGRRARPADVVGDDPESKSALVLSPYSEQFEAWDDAESVVRILGSTRGYAGSVAHVTEDEATAAHWFGWDRYDAIHIVTHGGQVCKNFGGGVRLCRSGLRTGVPATQGWDADGTGVTLVYGVRDDDGALHRIRPTYMLTGDFFTAAYPDGLDDTIVFLNACQSTADSGLADALLGSSGVVLGWDRIVSVTAAFPAAITFYSHLAETGLGSQSAFDEVVAEGHGEDSDGASLRLLTGEGELRLREVITVLDPYGGGEVREGGDYSFVGIAEDGSDDEMAVYLRVDGVPQGRAGEFTVHFSVDGTELSSGWTLADPEAQRVDEHRYTLTQTVDLGFDVERDADYELRAWVELPEGGLSEQVRTVNLEESDVEVVFESEVETRTTQDDGSVTVETSRLEASFALDLRDDESAYEGSGVLRYVEYRIDSPDFGECDPGDGDLFVVELALPGMPAAPQSGMHMVMYPDNIPLATCATPDGPVQVPPSWAFAWPLLHFGEADFSAEPPTYTLTGWTFPEDPSVVARKVYDQTITPEDDTTHHEQTTIEIRRVAGGG